jgi:hypothetical protein
MGPLEFLGELCTFDSAYIRGWRWLSSARYREEVRIIRYEYPPLIFVAGVLLTMILMLAEVVAVAFVIRWLLGL